MEIHLLVGHYFCHWEASLCYLSMRIWDSCLCWCRYCSFIPCFSLSHLWSSPRLQVWQHLCCHLLCIFGQCRRRWDKAQKLAGPVITWICQAWIVPLLSFSLLHINPGVPISSCWFPVLSENNWAGNLILPCCWCQNNSTDRRSIPAFLSIPAGHFWFSWGSFHGSLGQHRTREILKPNIGAYIQINSGSSGSH